MSRGEVVARPFTEVENTPQDGHAAAVSSAVLTCTTRVPSASRSTRSTRTPGSPNNNVVPSDTALGSFHPPEIRKLQTSEGQGPPHATTPPVSLHDGDARPIAKGRLGRPVEFGYKAQVTDNDDGVALDNTVEAGNPPDAPPLAPAIARVTTRTGRTPVTVTADRGYGEKRVEDCLHDLGVRTVVIPRKGKPAQARRAAEHRPAFRRTIKWRTGCEGRISTLKRGYGWDRTRIDNTEGARIWAGHGVLTHNLVKISALVA